MNKNGITNGYKCKRMRCDNYTDIYLYVGLVTSQATRALLGLGSGSTRKKLGLDSARELNEPSLSLNLGLINLGLDYGSARARLEKSSARAARTHPSLERGFRLRSPAGRI